MSVKRRTIHVPVDTIDRIYHVSDIHIRTLKRHDEYTQVFKRLYDTIREMGTTNAVCVVTGDIAHAKTEMSPELIDMIADFMSNLSSILPTIVIAGNHDQNLSNPNRQDVLAPIMRLINDPNLIYLQDSGAYRIGNCTFVHMACKDGPETFIKANDVPGTETKIALYHGPVDRSKTDVGYTVSNKEMTNAAFKGYDIGLLGDIHKPQSITIQHNVKYAGSLVQQNHGENLDGHGMLVWDVPARTATFVEIKNDYGYFTIDVDKGVIVKSPTSHIPIHARMRVRVQDTEASALKTIVAALRRDYTIEELTINRVAPAELARDADIKTRVIGDVTDVRYQTDLVCDYICEAYEVDDADLTRIRAISKELNSKLPDEDVTRNVHWKPKRFEFSNMFSYGPDNVVDFSVANGIVGLFAPNSSGKSSLLDALTFCIFDKSSRAFKAGDILNNKQKRFHCKLNFEINGKDYFIERTAIKLTSGNVKVDVKFWMINAKGETVSLNGEQRRDTNSVIRNYIGNYEDFVMTTFSVQNNNTLFIDLPQRERKDILGKFIGIDVFDKLYTMANDDIRERNALLKEFRKEDYSMRLADAEIERTQSNEGIEASDTLKGILLQNRERINEKILLEATNLTQVSSDDTSLTLLEAERDTLEIRIATVETSICDTNAQLEVAKENLLDLSAQLSGVDVWSVNENAKQLETDQSTLCTLRTKVDSIRTRMKRENATLEHLASHEYDPDCTYCVSRNESIHTQKQEVDAHLEDLGKQLLEVSASIDSLNIRIDANAKAYVVRDEYNAVQKSIDSFISGNTKLENTIIFHENTIDVSKIKLESVNERIDRFMQNETGIENNRRVNESIAKLKLELKGIDAEIVAMERTLRNLYTRKSVAETVIESVHSAIAKAEILENERKAYELYMEAVKRDGVPYELIAKIIPKIEEEVNSILSQIVDYGLLIEVDGKNINTYIAYDEDNIWPLELCGGMEKFISALSLRVALSNVSNLPRPNFLAIDEGFGVMDAERLNSIYLLFEHLKTQYDFILIISHIEHMKDIVDVYVEVKKENGYSKIEYV